jgi:hypothetical protein
MLVSTGYELTARKYSVTRVKSFWHDALRLRLKVSHA